MPVPHSDYPPLPGEAGEGAGSPHRPAPEAPPHGARHGAGCPALSLRRSAESSLSLAARSTRRKVPRRKGAEGRHKLTGVLLFWELGRLLGAHRKIERGAFPITEETEGPGN